MKQLKYDGPVVLVVMDGVGLSLKRSGNAVRQAHTEFLDYAMANYLSIPLAASGEAVGILPGQMGNSEVGHNALGSGRIIKQGIAGIEAAFATGDIWQSRTWRGAMDYLGVGSSSVKAAKVATSPAQSVKVPAVKPSSVATSSSQSAKTSSAKSSLKFSARSAAASYWARRAPKPSAPKTLHFCGIFSDGGVHSDIKHLEQMIKQAYSEGVRRIRVHCVFDGRDVAPQSEPKYIDRLEKFFKTFPKDADFRIASGGGRMVMTADRYENDWGMVKLGWDAMVHGKAPHTFTSAKDAIKFFRTENPKIQDQYLPAFVIVEDEPLQTSRSTRSSSASAQTSSSARTSHASSTSAQTSSSKPRPVGCISDGDAVIYYDFRADRAVEIATAFTEKTFDKFDRSAKHAKNPDPSANLAPKIYFAGLTEYDADRHLPKNALVPPIRIETPLNVFLGQNHISQLAVSETVKFGHITYYFNGNSYKKASKETHIEIPSDTQPFNTRPWMKSAEITDAVLAEMDKYQFIRINYPGGDMVGHFAELEPTIVALEAIDLQLARLAKKVDELGGMMIITADHGNAEELLDRDGVPKTAHTTNPVPCIFYDNTKNAKRYKSANLADAGITNLAATIATLLGLPDYPALWRKPLIK